MREWSEIGDMEFGGELSLGLSAPGIIYLLRDLFAADLAAGAVNATIAVPGPGTRNITDLDSRISISGGKLLIAAGGTAGARTAYWLTPTVTRVAGLVGALDVTFTVNVGSWTSHYGFSSLAAAGITGHLSLGIRVTGGFIAALSTSAALSPRIATLAKDQLVRFYTVLRAVGKFTFIKSSGTTKFYWEDAYSSTPDLYFVINMDSTAPGVNFDNVMALSSQRYQVLTTSSDSFNRANGALGSTDGLGHAEGGSGSGLAWAANVGSATISSNTLISSTLSGGICIETLDLSNADQVIIAKTTRAGGNVGLVGRYTDANNYVYAYHDGTNVTLHQVLAGVDTVLIAATASTYAAGARMQLSFDGVDCWLYYNELYIGVSNAVNAGLTGTKFGVYSSDAGNTYDDWRSYARSGYADLGAL